MIFTGMKHVYGIHICAELQVSVIFGYKYIVILFFVKNGHFGMVEQIIRHSLKRGCLQDTHID